MSEENSPVAYSFDEYYVDQLLNCGIISTLEEYIDDSTRSEFYNNSPQVEQDFRAGSWLSSWNENPIPDLSRNYRPQSVSNPSSAKTLSSQCQFSNEPENNLDSIPIQNTTRNRENDYSNGEDLFIIQKNAFREYQIPAESFKTCNCPKSKCLKKYCECFATRQPCNFMCKCENCENMIDHPKRNELCPGLRDNKEFDLNISTCTDITLKKNTERAQCTCPLNGCKQKHCLCYKNNVKCSDLCACKNCENGKYQKDNKLKKISNESNLAKRGSLNSNMNENASTIDENYSDGKQTLKKVETTSGLLGSIKTGKAQRKQHSAFSLELPIKNSKN